MYRPVFALLLWGQAVGAAGREPIAQKSTLVVSTVKRGELAQMVRGLGVLKAERTAEVKIAEPYAQSLKVGLKAVVDTGKGTVPAEVIRVDPGLVDGAVASICDWMALLQPA